MTAGQRVLVVDDEPQILRALGTTLRAAGYDVDTAVRIKDQPMNRHVFGYKRIFTNLLHHFFDIVKRVMEVIDPIFQLLLDHFYGIKGNPPVQHFPDQALRSGM